MAESGVKEGESQRSGEVVPASNLPGMGPMLSREARKERTWSVELHVVLAGKGADGLLDEVTDDLLEGCELRQIAGRLGVRVGELARFLVEREGEYRGMLRVKADMLAHETLGIADGAGMEEVALAKLRIDTRFKLASKWDRVTYGDEKGAINVGNTQITIVHESN